MQPLRNNASLLVRLVLAWFALTVLAASAAPVIQPQALDWVCSGGTSKLLVQGEAGDAAGSLTLKCPLCLAQDAPPAPAVLTLTQPHPLGHAVQPIPCARIAALTAAPLPARGPPASL